MHPEPQQLPTGRVGAPFCANLRRLPGLEKKDSSQCATQRTPRETAHIHACFPVDDSSIDRDSVEVLNQSSVFTAMKEISIKAPFTKPEISIATRDGGSTPSKYWAYASFISPYPLISVR